MTRPDPNQPPDWDFRIFEIVADECSEMETRLSGYARDITLEPSMDLEGARIVLNDYLTIQLGPKLAHELKKKLDEQLLPEYPWIRPHESAADEGAS